MTNMFARRVVALALLAAGAAAAAAAAAASVPRVPDTDLAGYPALDTQQNLVHSNSKENDLTGQGSVEPDLSIPVNERFPHAVLFGGTCGGSIISPTWILTAAHCTIFTNGRYVLAGTNHTRRGGGVSRRVKRLVVHPRFTVGPYWLTPQDFGIKQVGAHWDFLLAELEAPLPLDGRRLAAVVLGDTEPEPGLVARYAGFGAARHGEEMRHEMHGMELETLAAEQCGDLLEFDAGDALCTRGRAPRLDSACNGDSGSGLVAGERLIGVASWVEDDAITCRRGARVFFSKVAAARDWIRQVTKV